MAPRNIWLSLSLLGFVILLVSLAAYDYRLSTSNISGSAVSVSLEQDAFATLFLVVVGLVVGFVGFACFLGKTRLDERSTSTVMTISSILRESRYSRIFALSAAAYGVFFAIMSSTLVYQPVGSFSSNYGVHVPSVIPIVCCGPLGQMPQFIIYVTQHFAILLIPINLILLFTVSWLVGMNASVAAFAFKNRPDTAGIRWLSGLGTIIGLFTACPTCAGFFLLSMLGLSGAISLALTLASLQGLFILVGVPLLLASPLLTSRKIDRCFPSPSSGSMKDGNGPKKSVHE